jgi:hypothetical protein
MVEMKTITIIAALVLLAGMAVAQQSPAQPTPGSTAPAAMASNVDLPDGTVIRVELKNKIDTKKAKVGDTVTAEVAEDAKSPDGKVVVPKKTKLTGKITEADASTKDSPDAKLSFVMTNADVKGHPLTMTAYVIPPFKAPAVMQMDTSLIGAANQRGDTGPTSKDDPTAGKGPTGADASGLEGIKLKLDPKIGTYLVADKKNIVLESGTLFHVKQATLQPAAAAK